jgi:hypothetical protein
MQEEEIPNISMGCIILIESTGEYDEFEVAVGQVTSTSEEHIGLVSIFVEDKKFGEPTYGELYPDLYHMIRGFYSVHGAFVDVRGVKKLRVETQNETETGGIKYEFIEYQIES